MNNVIVSYSLYNLYNESNKKKNLILEPLSSLLKLGLLQYEESGTKVSVQYNSITYNKPSVSQGFFRSWKGDCREDLHNLCKPLMQCLEWYNRKDPMYQYFYTECSLGLRKLKEAYDEDSTIHHTITHYINIVEGTTGPDKLSEDPENPLVKTLRNCWTDSEIKLAYDLFHLIKESKSSDTYIKSLGDIIGSKERMVYEYIHKVSTTY